MDKKDIVCLRTLRNKKYWTEYERGKPVSYIIVRTGNIDDLYVTIEASVCGKSFVSSDEDHKKLFDSGVEILRKY